MCHQFEEKKKADIIVEKDQKCIYSSIKIGIGYYKNGEIPKVKSKKIILWSY